MKEEIEKQLEAIRAAQEETELTLQEIKSLLEDSPKPKPTVQPKKLPGK
jgi:hypothetical protein